jgi:hypothetical protein
MRDYLVECEIALDRSYSKGDFMASMPDAILAAFEQENIGR